MSDHDHHGGALASGNRRTLAIVLALVVCLLAVEVTVAVATGSLALASDAGHLATDVLGLGVALAAVSVAAARRPAGQASFGWHRLEILAALVNAVLLLALAVYIATSAIRRIGAPSHVEAWPLIVVAAVALAVNLVCARLLTHGASRSLNLEGARLEVLADAVGSVGVLITGITIAVTDWHAIDSIVAIAIVAWIVPRALRLGWRSVRILLQHAPAEIDVDDLTRQLAGLDHVAGVHDLHVWTLTSGQHVATAHLEITSAVNGHAIRHAASDLITRHTGITHVTIQIDRCDEEACCVTGHAGW